MSPEIARGKKSEARESPKLRKLLKGSPRTVTLDTCLDIPYHMINGN
jgi:hypothetical protein